MTAQLDGFENFQVLDIIEFNFKLIELRNTPLNLIVVGIPSKNRYTDATAPAQGRTKWLRGGRTPQGRTLLYHGNTTMNQNNDQAFSPNKI